MKTQFSLSTALALTAIALTGCFGGGDGDTTPPSKLDEAALYDWAVANNGNRVGGNLTGGNLQTLTETPDGAASAVEMKVVDNVAGDAAGAEDKADFLMDAQAEGGARYQTTIRSMLTGDSVGLPGDYQGGVAQNVQVFGTTGLGPAEFPQTKAYVLLLGQARLRVDGQTLDGQHPFQAIVTRAVHDDSGGILAEASEESLELHVYFPGRTLGGSFAIPGQTDAFLYFYFTNVKLQQLSSSEKAGVGAGLGAPQIPNEAPVAVASILVDGVATDNATRDLDANDGNLTITLDASNSTDPDGTINIYSWEVKEFKNNTTINKIFSTQGVTATANLSESGWYLVTLRVIDDRFEPAETTLLFFANYKKVFAHDFGAGSPPLNSVGGGQECTDPINCKEHQVSVRFGAQGATFTLTPSSTTQCSSPHLDLYEPGASPGEEGPLAESAEGTSLSVAGSKLSALGQYTLKVWFEAQVDCSYDVEAFVDYAPDVNPTASS